MRFIYTSDLHGNEEKYSQVLELVQVEKPDACIYGGDFFDFNRYMVKENHPVSINFLREFLKANTVPSFVIPGNMDFSITVRGMYDLQDEGLLTFLSHKPTRLGSASLYGYPHITPSPFRKKDYERRDLIDDNVRILDNDSYISHDDGTFSNVPLTYLNNVPSIEEDLREFLETDDDSIYVTHVPPARTGLDVLHDGCHVGSVALRRHILKNQPTISLHGHIHESPHISGKWAERLGTTISVNPGQQSSKLHAVIFEISDRQVKSLAHTVFGSFDLF
jgi:Icc-related predicted phosphoesterase